MALNFLKLTGLLAEKLTDVNSNKEGQKTSVFRKALQPLEKFSVYAVKS